MCAVTLTSRYVPTTMSRERSSLRATHDSRSSVSRSVMQIFEDSSNGRLFAALRNCSDEARN
jgi:hypothetical protein